MADAWLKGPVPDVPAALQPVAHALLNARIEFETVLARATDAELRVRPAGIASVGFHIRHACGSIDRLLTYARGTTLDERQLRVLAEEKDEAAPPDGAALRRLLDETMERALSQLRATSAESLDEARGVGRQRLPSTVRGLLFHAAEHAVRHAGQAITTMKVITGAR